MPLNEDFVGRRISTNEPFEVTRNDIRRFATAIGDPHPAYRDVEAAQALGYSDLLAPPTFLIVAGPSQETDELFADPALGLQFEMVVHGEQEFEFARPVVAGDVLDSAVTIASIRNAGRNEVLTLVTEVTCQGERVATLTNTLISRGTAAPAEA